MAMVSAAIANGGTVHRPQVARALLKARVGDVVRLVVPGGVQELEILSVEYPAAP